MAALGVDGEDLPQIGITALDAAVEVLTEAVLVTEREGEARTVFGHVEARTREVEALIGIADLAIDLTIGAGGQTDVQTGLKIAARAEAEASFAGFDGRDFVLGVRADDDGVADGDVVPGFAAEGKGAADLEDVAFLFDAADGRGFVGGAGFDAEAVTGGRGASVLRESRGRQACACLLYTSPSPRDRQKSRMPSSA